MSDTGRELPEDESLPTKKDDQNQQGQPIAAPMTEYPISEPNLPPQKTETQIATKFLRGPLKYDVDTSSPQLEAGRAFSVFVRVTNPYESVVTLLDVSASLPTEFRDKDNQDAGLWKTIKNQFKEELKGRIVVAQNVTAPTNDHSSLSVMDPGEILLQHGNSSLKRASL